LLEERNPLAARQEEEDSIWLFCAKSYSLLASNLLLSGLAVNLSSKPKLILPSCLRKEDELADCRLNHITKIMPYILPTHYYQNTHTHVHLNTYLSSHICIVTLFCLFYYILLLHFPQIIQSALSGCYLIAILRFHK
jgi:hypothetical protein